MPLGDVVSFVQRTSLLLAICVGISLVSTGCTKLPEDLANKETQAVDQDPLEPYNRVMYQFNYTADGLVLKPVATMYRGVVPEKGREMASNFISNLYMPVVFANSVMQRDPQNSFATLWRFLLNSSFGVVGLFDVAGEAGLKNRSADFGQTLALCGFGPGPYIVLPIIGPSNARDGVGRVADAFMNPFNYIDNGVSFAMWSATAVDKRASNMKLIDDIYSSSLDPYSTFRSGYAQKRAEEIRRARAAREKALEKGGVQ